MNATPALTLWIADAREAATDDLDRVLAEDEQARCRQFRRAELRKQFIVAHALKRICIANSLGASDPRALSFAKLASGKPIVEAPLHFNLSHSHGLCAVAVSELAACGVDIEVHGKKTAVEASLLKAMTMRERRDISKAEDPYRAFVDCWVVKEAYAKCTGLGLAQIFARLCTKQECVWTTQGHGMLRGMHVWRKTIPAYSVAICLDGNSVDSVTASTLRLADLLTVDRYEFRQCDPGRELYQTDRARDELRLVA